MFSCISRPVNGDENAVPTDLESRSSESSMKTPKRGLEKVGSKWRTMKSTHLRPNKISRFELNIKSNNTWTLDSDLAEYANKLIHNLAEYANKLIHNFALTQVVTERIVDKNPVPTNIKGENIPDPYLQKLIVELNKRIPLS